MMHRYNIYNKVSVMMMLAMALVVCVGCSESEEKSELTSRKAVSFSVYSNITRAAQTDVTSDNLTSFEVTALGNGGTYFDNLTFTKQTVGDFSGSWTSEQMYYWPNYTLDFYAYNTPATTAGKTASTDYKFTRSITKDGQTLYVKVPTKLASQEDLVAAYAPASSAGSDGCTALTFSHYMTQVVVKATNYNGNYKVRVYGVKLANMAGDGTFKFSDGTMTATASNVNSSTSVDYSETYKDNSITLNRATTDVPNPEPKEIMKASAATGGKWYLVPQTVTSWDQANDKTNTKHGTYLAIYVAITTNSTSAKVYPYESGKSRAWIAIPIDPSQFAFAKGTLYTVTVNFFKNGGAGYVDPETEGAPKPAQGEPAVIKKAIGFTKTVTSWGEVNVNVDL